MNKQQKQIEHYYDELMSLKCVPINTIFSILSSVAIAGIIASQILKEEMEKNNG